MRGTPPPTQTVQPRVLEQPEETMDEPKLQELEPEPQIIVDEGDSVTIHLEYPLRPSTAKVDPFQGVTKITVRTKLWAEDLMVMNEAHGEMHMVKSFIVQLSGQPEDLIDRLDARDYLKIHGVVQTRVGKYLQGSAGSVPS